MLLQLFSLAERILRSMLSHFLHYKLTETSMRIMHAMIHPRYVDSSQPLQFIPSPLNNNNDRDDGDDDDDDDDDSNGESEDNDADNCILPPNTRCGIGRRKKRRLDEISPSPHRVQA